MPSEKLRKRFIALAIEFSPENLTCDGALSSGQVKDKLKRLSARWRKLELTAGNLFTVAEVNTWADEDYRKSLVQLQVSTVNAELKAKVAIKAVIEEQKEKLRASGLNREAVRKTIEGVLEEVKISYVFDDIEQGKC